VASLPLFGINLKHPGAAWTLRLVSETGQNSDLDKVLDRDRKNKSALNRREDLHEILVL
jgi:hypothetical protein